MSRIMLPRILSRWNVLSRRQAEEAVFAGRVAVDGRTIRDVTFEVDPSRSTITLDGEPTGAPKAEPVWLVMNKPRGVVTTTSDPEGRRNVLQILPHPPAAGLAPVGRLDLDSGGVLLLTNEHTTAAALLDPHTHVDKRYRVKVRGMPDARTLERMRTESVEVDDMVLRPLQVKLEIENEASCWLMITLSEGKNRQLRRQLEYFGHPVEFLIREQFGPIALGELRPGDVRPLTTAEVRAVRLAAGPSRALGQRTERREPRGALARTADVRPKKVAASAESIATAKPKPVRDGFRPPPRPKDDAKPVPAKASRAAREQQQKRDDKTSTRRGAARVTKPKR